MNWLGFCWRCAAVCRYVAKYVIVRSFRRTLKSKFVKMKPFFPRCSIFAGYARVVALTQIFNMIFEI